MAKIEALKKITVKNIVKEMPEKAKDGPEKGRVSKQDLVMIYGKVRDHKVGSTQFGDYNEFIGNFEGRHLASGDIFQSTRLILPDLASDMLFNAWAEEAQDNRDAILGFAFVIGVENSEKGSTGYAFTCRQVTDPDIDRTDPLNGLREMLAKSEPELMGLPAPEQQPALESPKGKKGVLIEENEAVEA